MMMIGFLRMKVPIRTTTMNAMATEYVSQKLTNIDVLVLLNFDLVLNSESFTSSRSSRWSYQPYPPVRSPVP